MSLFDRTIFEASYYKKNIIVRLSLLIYLITAYNSVGYHHYDEHFQIIEFANYKLGLISSDKLAWEFHSQIRSGIQPFICFLLFKLFGLLGVTDAYTLTFLLRVLTAVLSVIVISKFARAYSHYLPEQYHIPFLLCSFLIWFNPYINVRFSSETWAGLLFLIALIATEKTLLTNKLRDYFLLGISLGCSVLFRYQMILCGICVIVWLAFIQRVQTKQLFNVLFGAALALGCGVFWDYWLYSNWTFSIWNYVNVNLVHGVSSQFGTQPAYAYLWYMLISPGPIGLLIVLSILYLWRYYPTNLILWCITLFIVVHSFIPHKELRFIFSIANLAPFVVLLALQKFRDNIATNLISKRYQKLIAAIVFVVMVVANIAGLYIVCTTGAGKANIPVTKFIHQNYNTATTNIIINGAANPYVDFVKPKNTFYSSDGLHIDPIGDVWQDDFLKHKKRGFTNLLLIYEKDITGEKELQFMKDVGLIKVYQNISPFTSLVYQLYDPSLNDRQMFIYQFK